MHIFRRLSEKDGMRGKQNERISCSQDPSALQWLDIFSRAFQSLHFFSFPAGIVSFSLSLFLSAYGFFPLRFCCCSTTRYRRRSDALLCFVLNVILSCPAWHISDYFCLSKWIFMNGVVLPNTKHGNDRRKKNSSVFFWFSVYFRSSPIFNMTFGENIWNSISILCERGISERKQWLSQRTDEYRTASEKKALDTMKLMGKNKSNLYASHSILFLRWLIATSFVYVNVSRCIISFSTEEQEILERWS